MDEKIHAEGGPGCFYCEHVKPFFRQRWSEATQHHFRNSRVEFLKGIRSLIDDRIDQLSKNPAKGTQVTVE